MNQYRTYLYTAVGSVLLVILLGLGWGWAILSSQRSVERSSLANNSESIDALQTFGELNRLLGFGGVIHNFKNFVIRQEAETQAVLIQSFNMVKAQEQVLRPMLTSPEEQVALDQIMGVVAEYRANYEIVRQMIENGSAVSDIDKAVQISDRPALEAQQTLAEILENRLTDSGAISRKYINLMSTLIGFGSLLLLPLLMLGLIFVLLFHRMKLILDRFEEAKKEVELLLETTPDSVMAVDESGTIVRANRTAMDFFGYGDALPGKKVEDLMPDSARGAHIGMRTNYFRDPESRDMAPMRRVTALLANGEVREVSIKLSYFSSLKGPTAVISVRDVTEENAFKRVLIDTQKRVDFAANVARFGIWEWNLQSNTLNWDQWTHRLHGTEADKFSRRYEEWLNLIHTEDQEGVNDKFRLAVETENEIDTEYRVILPDGVTHYLRLSAGVQCDDEGRALLVTGVSQDVTATRLAQKAMEEARSHSETANEVKGQFLANMSHEIRTPMNAILGLLTLLDNTKLADRQTQLVRTAHTSAKSLLGILNDILDLSKLEAGKVDIIENPFELDDVLNKNVDLFSVMAASKDILFYLKIDPDVYCGLVGDSLRLNQILGNLLSNAIKFTRRGSVTLTVSTVEADEQSCLLRFDVQDTGIGMTGVQVTRARAPFGQADMSTTRDFGGTGLGLPICDLLLALMGSSLVIDSVSGQSTQMSFELRFGLIPQSHRYSDLPATNKEVLLVFHDDNLRELVEQTIVHWARDRICCVDFKSALAVISDPNRDIEFLLTDYSNNETIRALETLCSTWIDSRYENRNNVVLVHRGYSDPLGSLQFESFSPQVIASPPTPSRLYDAMNRRKQNRSEIISPATSIRDAIRKTEPFKGSLILVVEDVVTNQIIARDFLTILGMEVEVASDGAEALNRVKVVAYDGVFMDFHMPLMNGLETTREIRKVPALKHLPIIAMTAAAFDQDKVAAVAAGMNDYLSKPVDINELADALVNNLPQRFERPVPVSDYDQERMRWSEKSLDLDALPDLVDPNVVLNNFNANLNLYQKCLRAFVEDFSGWVSDIEAAVERSDVTEVKSLLHKLKGTAANIGAQRLADLAFEVQVTGSSKNVKGLDIVKKTLLEFVEEIQIMAPEREAPSYYPAGEIETDLNDTLETLNDFMENLNNQRYIPSDVLDTWLSKIPSFFDSEDISELKKDVEMFDYKNAKENLGKIIDRVQSRLTKG